MKPGKRTVERTRKLWIEFLGGLGVPPSHSTACGRIGDAPSEGEVKRRYSGPLIACGASIVFGVFPVIVSLVAGTIASASGCALDEGSKHACAVRGVDIGDHLYAMGLAVWFSVATLPIGVAGLGVSFIWLMTRVFARN
jgi:hypothetical protein